MKRTRAEGAAVVIMTTGVLLAGCGTTVENVPLPKPGVSGPSYTIHAKFRDALNLPSRAHVKIGGSDIGVVTAIASRNFIADAELQISTDIQLPQGTTAELRQATPLGDMFVALTLPEQHGQPLLRNGDTIDVDHTSAGASVEELMMSLSMLLNGGALNQVARITTELNSMFAGRGPQLSHLLVEMTSVLGAVNARTDQLDSVLHGFDSLMGDLNRRKAELGAAADAFPPLISVIADNNRAISDLVGKVAVTMGALGDFANTDGTQFISLFNSVQKLMGGFTKMGDNLAGTLEGLHTLYPSVAASFKGNVMAVGATVGYLDINPVTDPQGSRLPDGTDVQMFVGSLSDVIQKVLGRLGLWGHQAPPIPPPPPGAPAAPLPPKVRAIPGIPGGGR